jgi:uncharacterized delta-60 repeat protein
MKIILLFTFCISTAFAQNTMVLDSTFGQNGLLIVDAASTNETIYSLVVQPDGKIVATGVAMLTSSINGLNNYDICTMRFHPDGTTDSAFGINGRAILDVAGNQDISNEVIMQPDGKILIVAEVQDSIFSNRVCCIRYNSNGSLDSTFGDNGIAMPLYNVTSGCKTIVLQADGKIILAGMISFFPGYEDFFAIRLLDNGSIDSGFGTLGIFHHNINNSSCSVSKALIQPDGKIVLGGYYTDSVNYNMPTLLRLDTVGNLDNSFGAGGIVTTDVGNGQTFDIKMDFANKIITIGNTYDPVNTQYITKHNNNGTLDNSFGGTGIEYTFVDCNSLAVSLVLRSGNKYLMGGVAYNCPPVQIQFSMAQFNNVGVLDTTFDTDGKYTYQQLSSLGRALTSDTYGAIYFGGEFFGPTVMDYMIIKLKGKVNFIGIENEPDFSFKIYPNPAEHGFMLALPHNNKASSLEIIDIAGKIVEKITLHTTQQFIETAHLPKGIYFIRVNTLKESSIQKLVKQ